MKRRDFLAMLSAAGIGTAATGALLLPDHLVWPWSASGGRVRLSHRRQAFGGLVTVLVELPERAAGEGATSTPPAPPAPIVVRESAPDWWREVGETAGPPVREGTAWRWTWKVPVAHPTPAEFAAELVRYRVVLLTEPSAESREPRAGLVSDPLEVVCGRGWGA